MSNKDKKYSFVKFINFILSFSNVTRQFIIDSLYDDTSDINGDNFNEHSYRDYDKFNEYIEKKFRNNRAKCTIVIKDDSHIDDIINIWLEMDDKTALVMSIYKYQYEKYLKTWLAVN